MTMPQQRMNVFLKVGRILMEIADPTEHEKKWGVQLPESLVRKANRALRYYPSSLEIERAVNEQKNPRIWMAGEGRGMELPENVYAQVIAAAARIARGRRWTARRSTAMTI